MVYIVLLNWNGWQDTITCLESIKLLNSSKYKVVICDNNSTDESYDKISKWCQHQEVTKSHIDKTEFKELDVTTSKKYKSGVGNGYYLIQTGNNLGYAGGNNVGIGFAMHQSDCNYVWLLNNDTTVTPTSLSAILSCMESNKQVGICGSRMVYENNRQRLQGFGGILNKSFMTTKHFMEGRPADLKVDSKYVNSQIDYVIGASMLLSKELLDDIGFLCEDYFLYYEELDFVIRTKKAGYKVSCAVNSVVYHKEGASTSGISDFSDFLQVKNRLVFSKKFFPKQYTLVWLSLILVFFNRVRKKKLSQAYRVLKIIALRERATFK